MACLRVRRADWPPACRRSGPEKAAFPKLGASAARMRRHCRPTGGLPALFDGRRFAAVAGVPHFAAEVDARRFSAATGVAPSPADAAQHAARRASAAFLPGSDRLQYWKQQYRRRQVRRLSVRRRSTMGLARRSPEGHSSAIMVPLTMRPNRDLRGIPVGIRQAPPRAATSPRRRVRECRRWS